MLYSQEISVLPHCIIEYSQELEIEIEPEFLINSVFQGALNSQLFDVDDIKIRAIAFNHYLSSSIKQNFIHVTIKILSDRNLEQRTKLSKSVLFELDKIALNSVSLTVEVYEIDKNSYTKVVK